jgi:hypothetical protein
MSWMIREIHLGNAPGKYKLVGCPKCGRPQITTATKSFKCQYGEATPRCKYQCKYNKILVHFSSDDYNEVLNQLRLRNPQFKRWIEIMDYQKTKDLIDDKNGEDV